MEPVTDVVLVGAGMMSATLGALLRELDSTLTIQIFDRLDRAAAESSDAWNNAGTGHSGFCFSDWSHMPTVNSPAGSSPSLQTSIFHETGGSTTISPPKPSPVP
jgi:L-2-hydroxyglutarate oxidase LhgO